MKSVYDEYSDIFNKREKWFRFKKSSHLDEFTIDNVFSDCDASNFIKYIFFSELLTELVKNIRFEKGRDKHTISAFLFGILLKEKLKISMRSLPKVCNTVDDSFIYFWSMTCLSHDLTFQMETSCEFNDRCRTIEDFFDTFELKHSLIDDSDKGEIFKKYYDIRIGSYNKMDHGITCGLLLYDLLLRQYESSRQKIMSATYAFTRDEWKYSNDFPKYALRICETIAQHNIWVADEHNHSVYDKAQLYQYIPGRKEFKKVTYCEKDSLLFLLGLVDTLDPVKCVLNSQKSADVYEIIKNVSVQCNYSKKRFTLVCDSFFDDFIINNWLKLSDWLDVDITSLPNGVKIEFSYQREDELAI